MSYRLASCPAPAQSVCVCVCEGLTRRPVCRTGWRRVRRLLSQSVCVCEGLTQRPVCCTGWRRVRRLLSQSVCEGLTQRPVCRTGWRRVRRLLSQSVCEGLTQRPVCRTGWRRVRHLLSLPVVAAATRRVGRVPRAAAGRDARRLLQLEPTEPAEPVAAQRDEPHIERDEQLRPRAVTLSLRYGGPTPLSDGRRNVIVQLHFRMASHTLIVLLIKLFYFWAPLH